jgi:dienelactone hydrolase
MYAAMRRTLSFAGAVMAVVGCSGANHQTGPIDAVAGDGPGIHDDASHMPTDAIEAVGPYGSNGSDSVTVVTATVAASSSFTVDIYLPSTSGPHPVVVLSSGLEQPAAAYASYGQRLASWGIIAILRDDPGVLTATSTIVDDVVYTVGTWLPAENSTSGSPLFGLVDTTRIGLAGHSRGGQVALLAAEGSASGKVVGMFGLDPVDGTSAPEAITTISTIAIPLAFIGETTDDASSGCAPSAQNFLALYGSASTPAVAITAVDADHTMFEDPASCTLCSLCTAGTASQPAVEAEAERYLMAFFARELLADASVGSAFQGAGIAQDVAAGLVTVVSK